MGAKEVGTYRRRARGDRQLQGRGEEMKKIVIAFGLAIAIWTGPAPGQAPQQPPAAAGAPIGGINLTNASLLERINTFARELKINYVLDASVKGGSVTVNTF